MFRSTIASLLVVMAAICRRDAADRSGACEVSV